MILDKAIYKFDYDKCYVKIEGYWCHRTWLKCIVNPILRFIQFWTDKPYVISWIAQEFLTDDWYKTEDEKYVLKNVRVYRRDMTKLDKYKHSNETQDIFEAQRYKTEKDVRMALDRMSKCSWNSDYKIHCVKIEIEVTSIIDIDKEEDD